MPYLLGVLAFVSSQVLIRIPLLEFLQTNSVNFIMFSIMQPVFYAIVLGLSAGIFEEIARFIMMNFFMKQRDWKSGFIFGVGHGGIEATLFVGIGALNIVFTSMANVYSTDFFIGGIERLFAILLHIGLSIIVLQSVVQKRFIYVTLAITIHAFVNILAGILPLFMSPNIALMAIEVSGAIIALAVFSYSLLIKKRGILQ